ncbi:MAG TPA: DNA-3-methyladenine glycosylase 2 family protein [Candidatus Paceibacterota bacterium]|nr:DNA-3-methyladenine glycosylase 2 family protein [Candidatus Paceibacterota bacterium]
MYRKAQRHFKKVDPVLHAASRAFHIEDLRPSDDVFRDLVWTIIGQQLSGKAADTIFARFRKLVRGPLTPRKVLALREEDIRASGISGAKMRAIRSVARAVVDRELDVARFSSMSDDEVRAALVQIHGIGPWTAEMILMFSLARADVFSRGDLGLRKGIMRVYGLITFPDEKMLERITAPWSPYRTYAARVLWKVADQAAARIGRKKPV